jgi:hypothetical protein
MKRLLQRKTRRRTDAAFGGYCALSLDEPITLVIPAKAGISIPERLSLSRKAAA